MSDTVEGILHVSLCKRAEGETVKRVESSLFHLSPDKDGQLTIRDEPTEENLSIASELLGWLLRFVSQTDTSR